MEGEAHLVLAHKVQMGQSEKGEGHSRWEKYVCKGMVAGECRRHSDSEVWFGIIGSEGFTWKSWW